MENGILAKYPWAANHQCAIQTTLPLMEIEPEFAFMQFNERLLNKISKDFL